MSRIIRGMQRVGAVNPQRISNLSGFSQAAASAGQASRLTGNAVGLASAFFTDQAIEEKALFDGKYVADIENKNDLFVNENTERFEDDAAAYITEAEARDRETLIEAKKVLGTKRFALLQISLEKGRVKNFVAFSDKQRALDRNATLNTLTEHLQYRFDEMTADARTLGFQGLASALEDLVILDDNIADAALGGGLDRIQYKDGSTAVDRLRGRLQAIKITTVGAALATEAEQLYALTTEKPLDTVLSFINEYAKTGEIRVAQLDGSEDLVLDTDDIDPLERQQIADYARKAIKHEYNTTAEWRAQRKKAEADAEAESNKADDLRQFKVAADTIDAIRKSKQPMTTDEIMAIVAENGLEAAHAASLFAAASTEWAQNVSAEQEMTVGPLLDTIRRNPGKWHAGDVPALIAANPELAQSASAISRVYSALAAQQKELQGDLAAMQSAAERMSKNQGLDYKSSKDNDWIDAVEKTGIADAAGAYIVPPIDWSADAEGIDAQHDTIIALTKGTGVMSRGAKAFFRSTANSDNVDRIRAATMLYLDMEARLPAQLFEQLDGATNAFYTEVGHRFLDGDYPEKAVAEIRARVFNPATGERVRKLTQITNSDNPTEVIREELKEKIEEQSGFFADLFDMGADVTDEMTAFAERRLQIEGNRYSDLDLAMKAVARTVTGVFLPSKYGVNGRNEFVRRPVEMYYNDADGEVDYIRWQVADAATAFFKKVATDAPGAGLTREQWIDGYGNTGEAGSWWLTLHPHSRVEAQPRYAINYIDNEGTMHQIGVGAEAFGFRPKPERSLDILKERDLASEMRHAIDRSRSWEKKAKASAGLQVSMNTDNFVKSLSRIPGGMAGLLTTKKAASDVIDWLMRGDVAQAYRSVQKYVRLQDAQIQGPNIGSRILNAIGFGFDEAEEGTP